jgi:putative lipoprotein
MMKILVTIQALALVGFLYGCAKSPGVSGGYGVLRGTVSYQERIALPANASMHVTLSDVSRQDAAAVVIAETRIPSDGKQVPLPFELRYERAKIASSGSYAVGATIESNGQIWFKTDGGGSRVLTQGNPADVKLMLVRQMAQRGLTGTTWRLQSIGGEAVLDRAPATLVIQEGKVSGRGSCNSFFGPVTIEGEKISFGPLGSTRMACAEAVSNQEAKYLEALQAAERFTVEGSTLSIHSRGMEAPLRFVSSR